AMVFQQTPGQSQRSQRVQAEAVVLATGARETMAPFPGWTLPGIMTVGAAQLLAKRHGVIPAPASRPGAGSRPRVLLAGSGLLLLPAAAWLAELGAQVVGVLETARPGQAWLSRIGGPAAAGKLAPSLWERRDEAWHYLSALRRHRIPYLFGRAVVRARTSTTGYLEAVDVARLDARGAPVASSTETWPVDLLCVGSGLVANVELAHLAGAGLTCDAVLGGWVVAVDEASRVRTSLPGLFVAGESAGICGAAAALLSGRTAGMSAAAHLGRLPQATLQAEVTRTAAQRRRHLRFGAAANLLFGAADGLYRAIPDDTPVCRCEDVTAGQVRAAIATGCRSLDGLKPAMRVGQGLCQGRTCGPILSRMLAVEAGTGPEAGGQFRPRPPVKPVPLLAIAGLLVSDEANAHGGLS
ncbi:MAG: (2Fe-2S)-binding protein, partial [Nitrososphaerales archaeon]